MKAGLPQVTKQHIHEQNKCLWRQSPSPTILPPAYPKSPKPTLFAIFCCCITQSHFLTSLWSQCLFGLPVYRRPSDLTTFLEQLPITSAVISWIPIKTPEEALWTALTRPHLPSGLWYLRCGWWGKSRGRCRWGPTQHQASSFIHIVINPLFL